MAFDAILADGGQFHRALSDYRNSLTLRRRDMSDDEVDAADRIIDPLFHEVVKSRPFSPGDVVAKGEAMIREYGGCGELAVEFVEVLLSDLRRLEQ